MNYISQAAFVLLAGFASWLFAKNITQIKKNIFLGKDKDLSDNPSLRWKNLLLLAFGQKKMFRNPLIAVLHFIIYAGFIIINIEVKTNNIEMYTKYKLMEATGKLIEV